MWPFKLNKQVAVVAGPAAKNPQLFFAVGGSDPAPLPVILKLHFHNNYTITIIIPSPSVCNPEPPGLSEYGPTLDYGTSESSFSA